MDGDNTAKTFDAGANSVTNSADFTESIHEGAHQAVCPLLDPPQYHLPFLFFSSSSSLSSTEFELIIFISLSRPQQVIKQPVTAPLCSTKPVRWESNSPVYFTICPFPSLLQQFKWANRIGPIAQGALGGTAQKMGGPFDKEGVLGKQFTTAGALGGTAQGLADKNQQH